MFHACWHLKVEIYFSKCYLTNANQFKGRLCRQALILQNKIVLLDIFLSYLKLQVAHLSLDKGLCAQSACGLLR